MKSVISMDNNEARRFFLKQESYCNSKLPDYINFDKILNKMETKINDHNYTDFIKGKPSNYDNVNYKIFHNKDGKYAWRPIELIHPFLYVNLVYLITETKNWEFITNRFRYFKDDKNILCYSIPGESYNKQNDKKASIINWCNKIEQESIKYSIEYEYMGTTDITDFYSSIYTHTIPWALHTEEVAKEKRTDNKLIGNVIDLCIRQMSYDQTDGIPQGSVLMDFIAEIVLGYADTLLSERLRKDRKSVV